MSWACDLTEDAQTDLRDMPQAIQNRVARGCSLKWLIDPFQGDVKPLHGAEWQGVFRRRIGDYRILFTLDRSNDKVIITRILSRSEKTYR